MSALVDVRCDDCGTGYGEILPDHSGDPLCGKCHGLRQNREGRAWHDEPNQLTPIEPLRPLEPAKSTSTPLHVNGSMGVRDGSMGVDETAARVKALGIQAPLGESFDCILPDHEDSARVHSTTRKHWHYRCAGEQRGLGLAEVRAATAYGSVRRISPVEAARWKERLDYEAGLREPRTIEFNVASSNATGRVANGLRLFLGLRDERWEGQPFTWARAFVVAYCDVTDQQARDAVWHLEHRYRVLVRVGKSEPYKPLLYQLGGSA